MGVLMVRVPVVHSLKINFCFLKKTYGRKKFSNKNLDVNAHAYFDATSMRDKIANKLQWPSDFFRKDGSIFRRNEKLSIERRLQVLFSTLQQYHKQRLL